MKKLLEHIVQRAMPLLTVMFVLLSTKIYAQNVSYSDIFFSLKWKTVSVSLQDDAKGGCWTNLDEVKTVAQWYLGSAGATVTEDSTPDSFVFNIIVTGNRIRSGTTVTNTCYANLEMNLRKFTFNEQDGHYYWSYMLQKNATGVQNGNFNIAIIDWLKKHLKDLT